jgi:hypothetical protein
MGTVLVGDWEKALLMNSDLLGVNVCVSTKFAISRKGGVWHIHFGWYLVFCDDLAV